MHLLAEARPFFFASSFISCKIVFKIMNNLSESIFIGTKKLVETCLNLNKLKCMYGRISLYIFIKIYESYAISCLIDWKIYLWELTFSPLFTSSAMFVSFARRNYQNFVALKQMKIYSQRDLRSFY